jgi:hypothetical protein
MAHANLVRNPLLFVLGEIVAVLDEATNGGGAQGS